MITREGRQESLAHLHDSSGYVPFPGYEALPTDHNEALAFVNSLKPQQYAGFAVLIERMLDATDQQRPNRPPDGLLSSPFTRNTTRPFEALREDVIYTLVDELKYIHHSPQYEPQSRLTTLISTVDPDRHIDLDWQLRGGITTAAANMTSLLEQLPKIIEHYAPGYDRRFLADIARDSVGLPWNMAMMCINRMMTLQGLVAHRTQNVAWGYGDTPLDPEFFEVHSIDQKPRSVRFKKLRDIEVPEGFTPHIFIAPLEEATKLGEIACHQQTTIGCPITLLPGRLQSTWNWLVDVVEQRNLWQEDPAAVS